MKAVLHCFFIRTHLNIKINLERDVGKNIAAENARRKC